MAILEAELLRLAQASKTDVVASLEETAWQKIRLESAGGSFLCTIYKSLLQDVSEEMEQLIPITDHGKFYYMAKPTAGELPLSLQRPAPPPLPCG